MSVVTGASMRVSGYAYTRNGKLNDGTENSCTMPCLFTYAGSHSGLFKVILFSRWPDMCRSSPLQIRTGNTQLIEHHYS